MAKKIMKPRENGAFIAKGDTVEFEIPYSTEKIIVNAVEINLNSGLATIHGMDKKGSKWEVEASNIVAVINKKLTLEEETK